MKIVHLICAARPNFMKVAPLWHALALTDWCTPCAIHIGQHVDDNMSSVFLRDFGVPIVWSLDVGSGGSHAEQTARTMVAYEAQCLKGRPHAIVVVGDVNATMACAIVGAKLGIPVVHLEAGLRSFDRSMPEEINRIVTDSVSNVLLTPSEDATVNLFREGVLYQTVEEVGNIMIDAFEMQRSKIEAVPRKYPGPYAVVTLHRPSNVDNPDKLKELWAHISRMAHALPVVFPVHPRTQKQFEASWRSYPENPRIHIEEPMPYVEFMALIKGATIVVTDSGGIQEETSYLGVPCATVRRNTERPITISHGTNELIEPWEIPVIAQQALIGRWKKGQPIPMWDGRTAERCVVALQRFLC